MMRQVANGEAGREHDEIMLILKEAINQYNQPLKVSSTNSGFHQKSSGQFA